MVSDISLKTWSYVSLVVPTLEQEPTAQNTLPRAAEARKYIPPDPNYSLNVFYFLRRVFPVII